MPTNTDLSLTHRGRVVSTLFNTENKALGISVKGKPYGVIGFGELPRQLATASFVGDTQVTATTRVNMTINAPTGVANGQLLVAVINLASLSTITPPSGWILVAETRHSNNAAYVSTFYKIADNEPSSWTWTFASSLSDGWVGAYASDRSATWYLDDASSFPLQAGVTSVVARSVTPKGPNAVLIGVFAGGGTRSFTPPVGMNDRYDPNLGPNLQIADEFLVAAAPTGDRTAIVSGANNASGQLLAFRPLANTVTTLPSGVQQVAPSADIAVGTWTRQDGGTSSLYTSVDEATPSDTDYITTSDLLASNVVELKLPTLTDPQTAYGHTISYRVNHTSTGFVELQAALVQGSTVLSSWRHPYVFSGPSTLSYTLSSADTDAITDYSDLRIRLSLEERARGFYYDDYRSVSAGEKNTTASIVVAAPKNVAQNDLLVVTIHNDSNVTITAVPTGWTLVDEQQQGVSLAWMRVYTKIAGASEPSSWTWTASAAVNSMSFAICYKNMPTAVVDVVAKTTQNNVTQFSLPSLTTTGRDCLILHTFGGQGARGLTLVDSRLTARGYISPIPFIGLFEEFRTDAGATGTREMALSSGSNIETLSVAFKVP
jgi:hypothetical protein